MTQDPEAAQTELDRLADKGFLLFVPKEQIAEEFARGTVSRLALITKMKEGGIVKHRIIIDMLRSGGNDRVQSFQNESCCRELWWPQSDGYGTRISLKGATPNRTSAKEDARDKAGLVHVKRLELARSWFVALLSAPETWRARRLPLDVLVPQFAITSDASPFGVGAILSHVDRDGNLLVPLVAFKLKVTKNIARSLGIEFHQPPGQAILEAWSTCLAFRYWAAKLKGTRCLLRADATVALAITRKLSSPNAIFNLIGAEIALLFEAIGLEEVILHHLAGKLNDQADHLSRPDKPGVPPGLAEVPIRTLNEAWALEAKLESPVAKPELWGRTPQASSVFDCL